MPRVIDVGNAAYEKGAGFTPIPNGTKVTATVFSIVEEPVKSGPNAGKPQLNITFKVQGGQWNGREIRYVRLPLYESNAGWKTVTFAEAVGWQHKPLTIPDDVTVVQGKALTIKVSEEPDRTDPKIIRNSVSGFAVAGLADAESAESSTTAAPSWGALNSA